MGIYILLAMFLAGVSILIFFGKKPKKTEERRRDMLYNFNIRCEGMLVGVCAIGMNILCVAIELYNNIHAKVYMNQDAIIAYVMFLGLSYLVAAWFLSLKIEVWKNKIISTYPWGMQKEITYTDIKSAAIENGKLVLRDEDGEKLFSYPNTSDGIFLEDAIEAELKRHGIKVMRSVGFVMTAPALYRVLYIAVFLVFIVFLLMSIHYAIFEGIVFFGVCIPFSLYTCLEQLKKKYVFNNECIKIKKVFEKEENILLKNITGYNCHTSLLSPELNDDAGFVNPDKKIVLYTDNQKKIMIPAYYTNTGALGMLIKKRNWKQK